MATDKKAERRERKRVTGILVKEAQFVAKGNRRIQYQALLEAAWKIAGAAGVHREEFTTMATEVVFDELDENND
jgi:hypothetical protein